MSDAEDGGVGGDRHDAIGGGGGAGGIGGGSYGGMSREEALRLRAEALATRSELDTRAAATQVWLVKVPSFVAERWTAANARHAQQRGEAAGEPEELGTLRVERVPGEPAEKAKFTLRLPAAAPWANDIPLDYTLRMVNYRPQRTYVLSEDGSGRARAVVGRVHHETALTPIVDERYRSIMRARAASASLKRKNIVTIDEKETKKSWRIGAANHAVEEGIALGAKKPGSSSGGPGGSSSSSSALDKRERLPKGELLTQLLDAFAEYPYWTFKGLQERTAQPQAWLKEVIADVLVLVKSGPYHGHYCLRPELAKAGARVDSNAAAAATAGGGGGGGGAGGGVKDGDEDDEEEDDDDDEDDEEYDLDKEVAK
ncbi:transcription initiation factor IIF, beta subunit-domain-containing protein [Zopfochytrium polystomum]|nr:transcription initiation factor IIF, beta subunit-domain-containing protein [Zopfochytrium polystomum]